MSTLIIPCAGKSSRFPNMRPKWMLTHPDGSLMIEKAMAAFNLDDFERIIITVVKEHAEKFEASIVIKQLFADKVELCILDDFTKSQSETVMKTIEKMGIRNDFIVKDSDNYVKYKKGSLNNFVVGVDLKEKPKVTNIPGKSFILASEQNILTNIVEKQIKSDIICVGIYAFESVEMFKEAYNELSNSCEGELYLSHIISYLISTKRKVFEYVKATEYTDWGTFTEWKKEIKRFSTYFVDIDGVLMKNCGKFGSFNWEVNEILLENNIKSIKKLQDNGAQIILVSARPEKYVKKAIELMTKLEFKPNGFLHSLYHGKRILINDFSATNPYPSAEVINLPRDGELENYL